ncbi:MAG: acyl-CoA dehydrogenase [Candidatus Anoxymicrobium japonicum]|uniref:Acyl-CoA dehydrogenase n=1 Tax=Candidatus Anoxymicrobium japonicum TaxID=2013648 RepID=A0A2N3G5R8_9ACTN|nr:MAG: acyl-CoA dehydrogenase [Candidatus Anoxymicrobium japonicum]
MFQLDEEQKMFQQSIRQFAKDVVEPRAAEIDESGEFPWDIVEKLKENGFLGLPFAEEYGGEGAGALTMGIAVEELSKVCVSTAIILGCQELGATPIKLGGSEEQKKKYLPQLASGEKLCGFGLTEPEAGSDAASMKTRAVKKGDRYILNGSKCFITNGDTGEIFSVFAMTDMDKGVRGISSFIVEKSFPGFSVGKHENKMGIRGSSTTELIFEDCEVPAENLLWQEGKGFNLAMMTLDRTRTSTGAQGLGVAAGALEYTIGYMKQRVQFGRPIAELQGLQFMVADLGMQIEAARSLIYRAAYAIDAEAPGFGTLSAMAKCFATDTAMKVTTDCVQLMGGNGYMKEYPIERMMRDAKITQIYEGTNQVQRVVIARALLQ